LADSKSQIQFHLIISIKSTTVNRFNPFPFSSNHFPLSFLSYRLSRFPGWPTHDFIWTSFHSHFHFISFHFLPKPFFKFTLNSSSSSFQFHFISISKTLLSLSLSLSAWFLVSINGSFEMNLYFTRSCFLLPIHSSPFSIQIFSSTSLIFNPIFITTTRNWWVFHSVNNFLTIWNFLVWKSSPIVYKCLYHFILFMILLFFGFYIFILNLCVELYVFIDFFSFFCCINLLVELILWFCNNLVKK